MLGTLFDKVTGLFDKRFTLALLLPTFALGAGGGALAATVAGWHQTAGWWSGLDAARQVALGVAAAAAIVVLAIIVGTQVVAMTRLLEGYWRWPADQTAGRAGRWWQAKRRDWIASSQSSLSDLRGYLEFPPDADQLMPTRLGNAMRAAESYPGQDRWGLDAVFWWPRLYLVMPGSARDQVDDARAGLDQLVVLSMLSAAFGVAAFILSFLGLNQAVGFSCAGGGLLLSRASYLAAVTSATVFGDLVRSCYDLYRGDLLTRLGWPMPPALPDERRLWAVLTKKLYRGDVDTAEEALLNAPRQPAAATPGPSRPGFLRGIGAALTAKRR
jgi:hypothetical protein